MAFVYLLGDFGQDNTYKIGITKGNIDKRIKQLQTGNGEEIFLVNSYETEYPFFIERMLHLKFCPKKKKNEWFNLEPDDVFKFKEQCQNIENTAIAIKDNPFSKKWLK